MYKTTKCIKSDYHPEKTNYANKNTDAKGIELVLPFKKENGKKGKY